VDAGFRSAAIAGDRLQIIDLATGKVRWSVTNEYFSCSAFTGDGKMLMTAQGTPSIFRAWDVSSGKPVARPVPLHSGRVDQFSLLPDGRTLVSESNDGSIQMWDVSDPTNPQALGRPLHGQGSQINWLALDSDAKTLFSGNFDGSIYAWDPKPRNPEKSPVVLTGVFDWQFAPDDRSLLTIDPRGHVTRREGPDFQVKNPLLDIGSGLAFVRDQAEFSDDGQLLAVSQAGEVRVWDLRNHSPSPRFVTPGWLGTRAFAPHSKLLVAYKTISGPLEEWDLNTFQKISSWPTTIPWKYLSPIALSSRGQYLLSASPGGSEGVVIETSTGQAGAWKNPESGEIGDLSFSADGSLFAAANWGGYAQVWDSRSRRLVMTLGHRQYPTTAVNFSPDDSRLVTASEGPDTLTLWDLSGRELLRLQTAAEQFMSVKFSADGTWLACHNYDNDLYLWRAPSWAEIEAAEKTVSDSQSSNMQKGNL
jgi:WD40 repeat protein